MYTFAVKGIIKLTYFFHPLTKLAPNPLPLPRHSHLLPQEASLAPALPFSLMVEKHHLWKRHLRRLELGPRLYPWWRPEPPQEPHSHVQRPVAPSGASHQAHIHGLQTINYGLRLFACLRWETDAMRWQILDCWSRGRWLGLGPCERGRDSWINPWQGGAMVGQSEGWRGD